MKNKLNAEEQLFRDKLNQAEADFNYQESNWQEMQQLLPKRGVVGKYGTLLKAGIGFALIVGLAYLTNTGWEDNNLANTSQQEKLTTEQALVSNDETTTNQQKNAAKNQANPQEEVKVDNAEKEVPQTTAKSNIEQPKTKQAESKINQPTEEDSKENNVSPVKPLKQESNELDFNLNAIGLEGKSCIGNTITAAAKSSGSDTKNMHYKWVIDDKNIFVDDKSTEIELTKAGLLKIEVYVLKDNKVVSSRGVEIRIPELVEVNFTYDDLESPYDDLKAVFKATPEGLSNLKWNIKEIDVELSGNEVSHQFDKKGVYDLSLSHTSKFGCIAEISKPIAISEDFKTLCPSDFTPNGDEHNETFIPVGFTPEAGVVGNDQFRMSIYDYNRKLVYTTTSNRDAWNGRLNNSGNVLPEGSYVWIVELENSTGQQASYAGKIRIRY